VKERRFRRFVIEHSTRNMRYRGCPGKRGSVTFGIPWRSSWFQPEIPRSVSF
jgi:hypothetical protein